jgi:tetratricopeptide (TPR) repeat protein
VRRTWLAALLLFCTGCASAPVKPALLPAAELADADAAVLRGCYDCLLEAEAIYTRAAAGPQRAQVLQRLFETELLIALREREFALAESGALERARALVVQMPLALEAARYIALVENVPAEHDSWTHADARSFRNGRRPFTVSLPVELAWLSTSGASPHVRQFLAQTLACLYPGPRIPAPADHAVAAESEPPLLRYRVIACAADRSQDEMQSIVNDVPEFVEVQYFLGMKAVEAIPEGGGPDPRPLIAAASARFSDAVPVLYLSARLQHVIGRCTDALTLLGRILAQRPEHETAWLGQVMCYTDLTRREEAIDAATHMIERRFDNMDEALYWRAWNYHGKGDLSSARRDIDEVRRIRVRPDTLTLAGIIEHDQDDLDPAERDLTLAARLNDTDCTARWYLGSVYVKKGNWTGAAPAFDGARACFGAEADGLSRRLTRLQADETLDADYKVAQIEKLRQRIARDRTQQSGAALNAAKSFGAIGNLPRARALVDEAGADASLKGDVDEFLAWLDRASRTGAAP